MSILSILLMNIHFFMFVQMHHDSIAFEIQKSTWIRQKQLDRNIKELRYDRNKEYLYREFKHYLVVNEHYDTIV